MQKEAEKELKAVGNLTIHCLEMFRDCPAKQNVDLVNKILF